MSYTFLFSTSEWQQPRDDTRQGKRFTVRDMIGGYAYAHEVTTRLACIKQTHAHGGREIP